MQMFLQTNDALSPENADHLLQMSVHMHLHVCVGEEMKWSFFRKAGLCGSFARLHKRRQGVRKNAAKANNSTVATASGWVQEGCSRVVIGRAMSFGCRNVNVTSTVTHLCCTGGVCKE